MYLWIHWTSCQFKFLMPLEPCRSLQFCVLEVHKSDAAHPLNASLFMENVVLCCSLGICWGWIKNRRVWSFVWCIFLVCFPKCFHFWLAKHWGEWPWCVACHQYGCSKSTQPGCVFLFCSKQSRFLAQHRLWQRRLFFFNNTMFYTWKRINNK